MICLVFVLCFRIEKRRRNPIYLVNPPSMKIYFSSVINQLVDRMEKKGNNPIMLTIVCIKRWTILRFW